jgi:hypothetical protein
MFTAFFDDSGTHATSEIAIAACYVSTIGGWKGFVQAWDDVRLQEDFDVFHMARFTAPPGQNKKPFCDWDKAKKERVYGRLARIINENKRAGIAVAVPKLAYDQAPESFRAKWGHEHYTFAVRMCLSRIADWREKSLITLPMQYIFDWEMQGSDKRREISDIWSAMHELLAQRLGTDKAGYEFQHKEQLKPLQAADILAWQMNNHMRKIFPFGEDRRELTHPGFMLLREDQEMDLMFFTSAQLEKFVRQYERLEAAGFTVAY